MPAQQLNKKGHDGFIYDVAEAYRGWQEAGADSAPRGLVAGTAKARAAMENVNPKALELLSWIESSRSITPMSAIREQVGVGAWDSIMLDALYRRVQAGNESAREEHIGMKLVSHNKNVKDFRTQYAIQVGDFTTFDPVAPQGQYYETWMSDDRASYAVAKYGKMFNISYEERTNDDLGVFGKTAERFGRAWAETVEKLIVATMLVGNPTIYDATVLFNATAVSAGGHANLLAAHLLSQATLEAAKTAMRKQTDMDGNPLNLRAKYLIVPPALEWTARRLVESTDDPSTANRAVNVHKGSLEVLVSGYITTATTWYLTADPKKIEMFEMGFLNGREDAEVHEEPDGTGAGFDRDVKRYRARGIVGGACVDWRGFHCCTA